MLGKKNILILNIFLSLIMVVGIILLIYTFIFENTLHDKVYINDYIESFGEKYRNVPKIRAFYTASILSISLSFIFSVMTGLIAKKEYLSKTCLRTQLMGGLVVVTTYILIKDFRKKQGGKDV